jgi:hypothetical protein
MVSLERDHLELEIIGKKVLLSVTLGEPQKTWPISSMKSAIYFYFKNTTRSLPATLSSLSACFVF